MGIKKLSWKKIGGIVFIIAAIITILTNLKFVWNGLKFLGNWVVKIFAPLSNSIVRDVLLLALVVGILIWLILINKKFNKLKVSHNELAKSVLEIKKIREEKVKIKEEMLKLKEHSYVLGHIADAPKPISQIALFEPYQKQYPNSTIIDLKSIIIDLLEMKLICLIAGSEGGVFDYKATDKGVKSYQEVIRKNKKQREVF